MYYFKLFFFSFIGPRGIDGDRGPEGKQGRNGQMGKLGTYNILD